MDNFNIDLEDLGFGTTGFGSDVYFQIYHHLLAFRPAIALANVGNQVYRRWLEDCRVATNDDDSFDAALQMVQTLMAPCSKDPVLWFIVEALQAELQKRFGRYMEEGKAKGKFFVWGPWVEKPMQSRTNKVEVGTVWGDPYNFSDFSLTLPAHPGVSFLVQVTCRVDIPTNHIVI